MIEVKNLSKNYGKVEAVKDISFNVERGEIFGLLGPNGAGKSSTINIISGLLAPSSGTAVVGGFDITTDARQAKRTMGVVPQQSIVIEELSALQNCLFFGSLYGLDGRGLKSRALELLSWIGLADRISEPVSQYSGGMLRRLTLVLGILHEPAALVLDEPTVGLDPQTRLLILDAIEEIASKETAVLLSTHYLDEAERLCGRMAIIDEGTIIKEGTLAELRAQIEDIQIVNLRGDFDPESLHKWVGKIKGAEVLKDSDGEAVVSLPSGSKQTAKLLENASTIENLREINIRPPSLESLFIRLTGREIRE